ncbi:hypothetical protein HA402_001324 [Bradysia odoriphaga]|nr:hypothetical protein HA402_001324 [Bradysia odoriphaga]
MSQVINACQSCTFTNESGAKICMACGRTLGLPVLSFNASDGIECSQCTYQNPYGSQQCVICEKPIVTTEQVNMSSTMNVDGQLCQICFSSTTKEFKMPGCTHSFCVSCSKQYFTVKIMEYGIHSFRCPIDGCVSFDELPNKSNFFKDLKLVLGDVLNAETQKVFDNKIGIIEPGFVRCPLCNHGFINQCKSKLTHCTACLQSFCNICGRKWTQDHSQTNCEANDRSVEDGESSVLQMNTNAACPQCKYKYYLERGGCMHITCIECSYEYCEFCLKEMTGKGKACNFPNCSMERSLHGHHPRNCMYYVREMNHTNLEALLKANGVHYNLVHKEKTSTCPVKVNKDMGGTWVESECNQPSTEPYNMCLEHYKWYLGELIKIHSIDPVDTMNNLECMCELKRNNVPLQYIESYSQPIEDTHTAGLRTLIRENIPYEKLLQ